MNSAQSVAEPRCAVIAQPAESHVQPKQRAARKKATRDYRPGGHKLVEKLTLGMTADLADILTHAAASIDLDRTACARMLIERGGLHILNLNSVLDIDPYLLAALVEKREATEAAVQRPSLEALRTAMSARKADDSAQWFPAAITGTLGEREISIRARVRVGTMTLAVAAKP